MTRGMTKEQEIEIEQRRKVVTANILGGLNYRDMAAQLGVSIGTISNDVKVIVKRLREAQVTDYAAVLEIELRRIDTALNAIWDKVQQGNLSAITAMMMLQNQRARFIGFREIYEQEQRRGEEGIPALENLEELKRRRWSQVAGQLLRINALPEPQIIEVSDESSNGNGSGSG